MCNLLRYKEEIQEATGAFDEFSHIRIVPKFRWRVPPSEAAPVLRWVKGKAQIDMLNFGFRTGKGGRQLMARSETAAEKDMWREAMQHRRCLLLVHGFYDNEQITRQVNQPWYFQRKGAALMAMAALWEDGPNAGNFAIMSCEPNALVRRVIDRMPVILPRNAWNAWLSAEAGYTQLLPLLQTFPAEDMERWQVSREVNKGLDSPESIAPASETNEGFDFL
jgi:putative SOS response-associated peptidase YedK